jgi:hypothetical protein
VFYCFENNSISSIESDVPVMENVFPTEPYWKSGLEVRRTVKTQISDRGLIGLGIFRREIRYSKHRSISILNSVLFLYELFESGV